MIRRVLCLMAASLGLLAQEPAVTFGTTVVIPSGLEGRIYHIKRYAKKLPNLAKMKPVGSIYTTSLNIPPQNFLQGFPGVTKRVEWFAIDYRGRFWAEKAGYYDFSVLSDDGSIVYVDDEIVVDNDGQHAPQEATGSVRLTHGVHDIRVSYFQGPGTQIALVLKVAPPGEKLRLFDTNNLKPPPEP